MTKTTDQLLEDLATKGGAIVATGNCSPLEIAVARRCGDMAVRDDGIGFIRRSPGWVKMADEGLAVRAYDAAMRPRGARSNTQGLVTPGTGHRDEIAAASRRHQ